MIGSCSVKYNAYGQEEREWSMQRKERHRSTVVGVSAVKCCRFTRAVTADAL